MSLIQAFSKAISQYPLYVYAKRVSECADEGSASSDLTTLVVVTVIGAAIILLVGGIVFLRRYINTGAPLYYKALRRTGSAELLPTNV